MVDFDRLNVLIKETGKTKSFLCAKAGKSRGYIANAQAGNGSVSDDALKVFADELGTSVEYLRGETDEKSAKKEAHPEQGGLRPTDQALLDAFKSADLITQELIRRALGL